MYFSLISDQMKWAKLELKAEDGRGKEFLGKKLEPIKWKEMALETHRIKFIGEYCGVTIVNETVYCRKCGKKVK